MAPSTTYEAFTVISVPDVFEEHQISDDDTAVTEETLRKALGAESAKLTQNKSSVDLVFSREMEFFPNVNTDSKDFNLSEFSKGQSSLTHISAEEVKYVPYDSTERSLGRGSSICVDMKTHRLFSVKTSEAGARVSRDGKQMGISRWKDPDGQDFPLARTMPGTFYTKTIGPYTFRTARPGASCA